MINASYILSYIKQVIFEFFFILQYNSILNKHILILIQVLQIFPLIFFYLNPIYSHLNNFSIFRLYIQDLYPKLIFIKQQKQQIVSLIFLLITPSILIGLIIMKYFVGYQYILVFIMEVWIVIYPIWFVKIAIESMNILVHFQHLIVIGSVLIVFNIIASWFILNYYNKRYKYVDILPLILIFINIHPYVSLSLVFVKIIVSYLLSPVTLIRNLRLSWQLSLLIIIFTCNFCDDILTNLISFGVLIFTFISPQLFRIFKNYHKYQTIFYRLQNMLTQQQQKIYFYSYIENHRQQCVNMKCLCRQIASEKNDQVILEKAYKLVQLMYRFKQDFISRIQLGKVCYEKYDYSLSGLLDMFQLQPQNIYQQYKVYYNKTVYEQQFRKNDKNYSFGQQYFNVYEQYRQFQQSIQNLTLIIKKFWQQILNFDGSRKFLQLIIQISEKINNINQKYEIYNDKYEQYPQFKYLYTTFQIAILNIINSNFNNGPNSSKNSKKSFQINTMSQPINIKIPDRQLFFISVQGKIINCNRDFCNFLQINKTEILNKPYDMFLPQIYRDVHKQWQSKFFSEYNKQQTKQTYKTFKRKNQYIKVVKMSNRIVPRFQAGIQIITFIKLINNLQTVSKGPQSEYNKQNQNFYSFLIEKSTLNIIYIDESFFYANDIKITEQLRKKILQIKITDIYPKFTLRQQRQNNNNKHEQKSYKQVILNYTILNDYIQKKQKIFNSMMSMNSRSSFSGINNNNILSGFSSSMNSSNIMNIMQNSQKAPRRKSKFKGVLGNALVQKQKTQCVFCYQVIQQLNKQMNIQYCIVNFKAKTKTNYDMQFINQFKIKQQASLLTNQQNIKKQLTNGNNKGNSNNNNNNDTNNLSAQQQQSQNLASTFNESQSHQKSYCLPWIIVTPLILIHFIYLGIQLVLNQLLIFMQNSFNFYKMYQLTILKLLNIKQLSSIDYLQDMKKLWIQGYGFYHQSLLVFQKSNDEQFKIKLFQQVIKINHIGIYNKISEILNNKYQLLHILQLAISIILIVFIIYIIIDFIFNILYAFRTYKKVVQIILIFLNIQKHDVNRMVSAIDIYQYQILQMYYYNKNNQKIKQQMYLFDPNYDTHLNNGENSMINLVKDSYRYNQTFRDSLIVDNDKKYQQNPRKTGLKDKIDIQIFKKKMQQFKNSNQQYNPYILNSNPSSPKTLPFPATQQHCLSPQNISFQYDNNNNNSNQLQQQQQKHLQIQKFKSKYTQKCNQIKQNLNIYILILLGFILSLLVLAIALIFILEFIYNYYQYGQVYKQLQMMNIVLFKQLIHKITNIQLQPFIKMSQFNQNFYLKSNQLLTELTEFQIFWQSIYKNNVCPFITQIQLQSICIKLDNSIVNFGQKVISQYLQQYLRLNSASNLLNNQLLSTKQFYNVVIIQLNLILSGQMKLYQNIQNYLIKTSTYQLLICCIGTFILFVSILLLRKALNQIKSKINDGENLLLIVPEKIKIKYMEKNKIQEISKNSKDKSKNNKNKNNDNKFKMKKDPPQISEVQCSASSLVPNSQGKSSPVENIRK